MIHLFCISNNSAWGRFPAARSIDFCCTSQLDCWLIAWSKIGAWLLLNCFIIKLIRSTFCQKISKHEEMFCDVQSNDKKVLSFNYHLFHTKSKFCFTWYLAVLSKKEQEHSEFLIGRPQSRLFDAGVITILWGKTGEWAVHIVLGLWYRRDGCLTWLASLTFCPVDLVICHWDNDNLQRIFKQYCVMLGWHYVRRENIVTLPLKMIKNNIFQKHSYWSK